MYLAMLALCLVATTLAVPLTYEPLQNTWELFKQTHKKQYVGDVEMARKMIFNENLKYINQHNMEADMGKYTYWLGVNKYADWTNEEFRAFMNGYKMGANRTGSTFLPPLNMGDLPSHVDWRDKGYVTPVKDQQQCGSCWAFSATGALEGQHFRQTGQLVSLSEQNLVDCSVKEGDHGCDGGLMDFAFQYVVDNNGIDTEQCYPYDAQQETCHFKRPCVGATCTGFIDIAQGDEVALQKASATVGPIAVAIDAGHLSFQHYKHGVYNEPQCSSTSLDHGVLVVGYGSTDTDDYWIVKNSWGVSWGMEGYIRMTRNKNNQCGIATSASYPVV